MIKVVSICWPKNSSSIIFVDWKNFWSKHYQRNHQNNSLINTFWSKHLAYQKKLIKKVLIKKFSSSKKNWSEKNDKKIAHKKNGWSEKLLIRNFLDQKNEEKVIKRVLDQTKFDFKRLAHQKNDQNCFDQKI